MILKKNQQLTKKRAKLPRGGGGGGGGGGAEIVRICNRLISPYKNTHMCNESCKHLNEISKCGNIFAYNKVLHLNERICSMWAPILSFKRSPHFKKGAQFMNSHTTFFSCFPLVCLQQRTF